MEIANGLRIVKIEANGAEWIACYFVHGSAVRSRTFKTEAGAIRWAGKQVGK